MTEQPNATAAFVNDTAMLGERRGPGEVRLSVEQASHAYGAGQQSAPLFTLEATTLYARQRELVAILGPNASGKSTLLKLMSGALPSLSGRVLLDGFEVAKLDARTRAQRIAVVQQESPLLFPVRVWDYVMQGRHPYGRGMHFETPEDAALVEKSLEQVGALHLRARWMQQVSGGEKQRISIARAILHNPRILILDEATSSVDVETEREIQEAIQRLVSGRTTFAIAHRLSTLRKADRLIVMERGKIVEQGTHEELMNQKGVFHDLVQTQSAVNEIIGIGAK